MSNTNNETRITSEEAKNAIFKVNELGTTTKTPTEVKDAIEKMADVTVTASELNDSVNKIRISAGVQSSSGTVNSSDQLQSNTGSPYLVEWKTNRNTGVPSYVASTFSTHYNPHTPHSNTLAKLATGATEGILADIIFTESVVMSKFSISTETYNAPSFEYRGANVRLRLFKGGATVYDQLVGGTYSATPNRDMHKECDRVQLYFTQNAADLHTKASLHATYLKQVQI